MTCLRIVCKGRTHLRRIVPYSNRSFNVHKFNSDNNFNIIYYKTNVKELQYWIHEFDKLGLAKWHFIIDALVKMTTGIKSDEWRLQVVYSAVIYQRTIEKKFYVCVCRWQCTTNWIIIDCILNFFSCMIFFFLYSEVYWNFKSEIIYLISSLQFCTNPYSLW